MEIQFLSVLGGINCINGREYNFPGTVHSPDPSSAIYSMDRTTFFSQCLTLLEFFSICYGKFPIIDQCR